jgi:predicted transcriptional regulator
MTTQTESVSNVFDQVFDNLRKTAESNLELQQEFFRQWGANWPGFPQQENAWLERVQKFQKEWSKTYAELVNKHRKLLDDQYRMAIDALKEAFRVAEAGDPQEYQRRCEELCRKSLELIREAGELQIKETQEALNRWVAVAVKSAS